ncbi:hypothetical protein BDR04DRAFT_1085719 [Suillus decipiens]|nr:hypothetical protein BDR04DRAFT_1085719 [Suillus decipiens]
MQEYDAPTHASVTTLFVDITKHTRIGRTDAIVSVFATNPHIVRTRSFDLRPRGGRLMIGNCRLRKSEVSEGPVARNALVDVIDGGITGCNETNCCRCFGNKCMGQSDKKITSMEHEHLNNGQVTRMLWKTCLVGLAKPTEMGREKMNYVAKQSGFVKCSELRKSSDKLSVKSGQRLVTQRKALYFFRTQPSRTWRTWMPCGFERLGSRRRPRSLTSDENLFVEIWIFICMCM